MRNIFLALAVVFMLSPAFADEVIKAGDYAELKITGKCLSGPSVKSKPSFSVTKGEEVKVDKVKKKWVKIINKDGLAGWAPVKSLKKVDSKKIPPAPKKAEKQIKQVPATTPSQPEPPLKTEKSDADKPQELAVKTAKEEPVKEAKKKLEKNAPEEKQAATEAETINADDENEDKIEQEIEEEIESETKKSYFSTALKLDLLIPTSNVDTTYAVHLDVRYILPWWNPHLSVGIEAGYLPLSGEGKNLDAQVGLYDFEWHITNIPLFFGVGIEYPMFLENFVLSGEIGYALILSKSTGKIFNGEVQQSDKAMGLYFGGGAEFRFPPFGGVLGEVRYTDARLDFNYPEYNLELGIIGGTSVLVGYRYIY